MFVGYRDEVLIGEGGLGKVYRAVRVSTGGVVAIKQLSEVPSASPAWHRAKRELEAMLRLKGHPYVVSVEEIIDSEAGPCLVMEYLDGGTLMDRLVGVGPLSPAELILVGLHVTQALMAAHEVGIVHRDIKPHNLLVGVFGQVKVADFGIAALTREAGLHTRTQAFTLAYASPEELDGEAEIGPPADVYSLAATLSHLVTGRKPSRVRAVTTDIEQLMVDEPSLQPVLAALLRCLDPNPATRPSMSDMHRAFTGAMAQFGIDGISRLAALPAPQPSDVHVDDPPQVLAASPSGPLEPVEPPEPAVDGATIVRPRSPDLPTRVRPSGGGNEIADATAVSSPRGHVADRQPDPQSVTPAPTLRRRRLIALVSAAVTVAVVAAIALVGRSDEQPTSTSRATATTSEASTSTLGLRSAGNPIATLTGNDWVRSGVFSPDGDTILTTSDDDTARLWDDTGNPIATLTGHTDLVRSGVFSPDGDTILTTSDDGTARLWDDTGNPIATLTGNDWVRSGVFSPDGDTILTTSDDGTARLWDDTGNPIATLTGHTDWVRSGVFSPDGDTILTTSADGTARLWST